MDSDGKGSNDAEKVGVESSSAALAEVRDQPAAEPPAKSSEPGKEESVKTGEECSASGGVTPASDTEKSSSEVPLINGECVKAGGDVPSEVNGVDGGEKDKVLTVENEIVCASKVASDKDDDDVILIVEKSNEKVNGDQAADASLSAVEKIEKLAMDVEKYIVASVHDLIEPPMTKDVADKAQNNAGGTCGAVIKDDGEVIETCSIGNPYVCGKSAEEDMEAKEIPAKDNKEALESESLVPGDKAQEERLSELKSNGGSSEQEIKSDAVDQGQTNAAAEPPANAEGGAGANAGDNDNKDGSLPTALQLENQPEKKELGAADVPTAEITTSESGAKTTETASSEVKPEVTSVIKVEAGESVEHEAKPGDSNDQKVAEEQKLERSETSSAVMKEAKAAVSSVREEISESISQSAMSTESETVTESNIVEKSESVLTSKQVEDTVSVSKEMKTENSVEVVENVIEAMSQVTREISSKATVRQISESSTSVERIEIAAHALGEGKEAVLADDHKTSAGAAAGSEVDIKDHTQKTETVPENEKLEVKSESDEASKCPADPIEGNLKRSAADAPPAQDITPAEGTQSQGNKVSVEGLESTPKDETVSKETSGGQEEQAKEVISVQQENELSEKEVVPPEKEVVDSEKEVVPPEKMKVELEKEVASSKNAVVVPEKEVISSEKTVAGPEKKVESPDKEVVVSEKEVAVPKVVEIPEKGIEVPEKDVASSDKDTISHEEEPEPVEHNIVSSVKDLSPEQDLTKEKDGVSSEKDAPAVSEAASTAKETVRAENETIGSEHTAVSSEEQVVRSENEVVSSEKELMSSAKIIQSEESVSLSSEKTVVSSAKVSVKKGSVSASSRTTSVTRSAVSRTSVASSRSSRVVRRRSPTKTGRSRASRAEEGHDSGVDETTQSQNGESASPPKGGRASPRKRQPRSMDPSPMKRLSGSSSTASIERKKVPMNKIEVGKSASPNLKQVKSKIGSLNNTTYKPGGGNVKIESKKLDYSKASSRITAKNEDYKPRGGDKKIESQKLKWSAQSKVGSLENTTHKPGGGARKIESQKLNFKDSAQSKVGSRENIKHKPGGGDVQNIKIQEQRLDFKEKASSKIGSLQNVTHRPGGGEKRIFDDKEYLRQRSNESRSPCKTPSSVPGSEYSASRPESPEGTNPVSQATSGVTSPQPDVTSPQPNVTSPQPNVTSPQPNVTSPPPAEA